MGAKWRGKYRFPLHPGPSRRGLFRHGLSPFFDWLRTGLRPIGSPPKMVLGSSLPPHEVRMALSLQSTCSLMIAHKRYFGTVWRMDGAHLLMTCRAEIPPDSHARLLWELESDELHAAVRIEADVLVRRGRAVSGILSGSQPYSLEIRAMSGEHQQRLDAWTALRSRSVDVDPERPTEMVLGGSASLLDELPTAHVGPSKARHASDDFQRHPPSRVSGTESVEMRTSRARAVAADGRLELRWASWSELAMDWNLSLSRGLLHIPVTPALEDAGFAILAILPDGRRALLRGRVLSSSGTSMAIEVSMGDPTRALIEREIPEVTELYRVGAEV